HTSLNPPILSPNSPHPSRALHSFPTRRSSDLSRSSEGADQGTDRAVRGSDLQGKGTRSRMVGGSVIVGGSSWAHARSRPRLRSRDRKSTRLNSSHVSISYAVFCLKKKKHKTK